MIDYLDPRAMLGQTARIFFGEGTIEHRASGIVVAASSIATPADGAERQWSYRVEIASVVDLIDQAVTSRIFQELSVPDIVKMVLADHGLSEERQRWELAGQYPPRTYCVQYGESARAFCQRLLEVEGIFFATRDGEGGEELVFWDDVARAESAGEVRYVTASNLHHDGDAITSVVERHRVRSGKVVLRDYDFERPDLDLTVEATADRDLDLEQYDYPGCYVDPSEGERYARVRLEAERAQCRHLEVRGHVARLVEGGRVALSDAPDGLEGEYLVTAVTHSYAAIGATD